MCIEKLSRLGFTEKEALVYLMLFRMGPSPVSALAQRVQLKRVTVYALLDALESKGLVTVVETDQGRRYFPGEPSCILDRIEEEQRELQNKLKLAEECVQELELPLMGGFGTGNRVRFHRGELCVKKILGELFDPAIPMNGLLPESNPALLEQCLNVLTSVREKMNAVTVLKRVATDLSFAGVLLLQMDTVAFLAQRSELELMVIHDPFYAHYVRQVLFFPYFSKKSVGAMISKGAPVKG